MDNYKLEYWIEAVMSALDEIDEISLFTDQNIKDLAESMLISAEQEGMAFGYDVIPNPLSTEITKIKEENAREIADWENRDRIYRQSIADAYKLSARDMIYISRTAKLNALDGDKPR